MVMGDSGPVSRDRGFHQLSLVTRVRVRGLMGRSTVLDDSGSGPRSRVDDQLSRVTVIRSRARGVYQLSWETRAQER